MYNFVPTYNIKTKEQSAVVPAGNNSLPVSGFDKKALLDAFESSLAQNPQSRIAYRKAVASYLKWVVSHGYGLAQMDEFAFTAYIRSLKEDEPVHSSKTINLYIVALKTFYSWAAKRFRVANITAGVKSVPYKIEFVKESLSEPQATALMEYFQNYHSIRRPCRQESERRYFYRNSEMLSKRNYAMVNLMLRCGLRTIEVSRLKVEDMKLFAGYRILMVWGKGHSCPDKKVRITDRVYLPIMDYLNTRGAVNDQDPLFAAGGPGQSHAPISPRMIQRICKEGLRAIGIDDKNITTHSLRHTAAEMMIEKGASLLDVQTVLRHSSPTTTEIYIHRIMERRQIENPVQALLDGCFLSENTKTVKEDYAEQRTEEQTAD